MRLLGCTLSAVSMAHICCKVSTARDLYKYDASLLRRSVHPMTLLGCTLSAASMAHICCKVSAARDLYKYDASLLRRSVHPMRHLGCTLSAVSMMQICCKYLMQCSDCRTLIDLGSMLYKICALILASDCATRAKQKFTQTVDFYIIYFYRMAKERLDLIIFGATGFTGKRTVKEAAILVKNKHFTWGIAGRRKETLESVLKEFDLKSENIQTILADIKDEESLKKMTEQAKVIVNCTGPYRFYGEAVIKACIATHTHHVDISGEPNYMEKIQLDYNEAAQKAGVYIVSACGFVSLPADLGMIFTQKKFEGQVNSIESYVTTTIKTNVGGPILHYGTWESGVYDVAHTNELEELRKELFPEELPEFKPKLEIKCLIHRSTVQEGWSTILPSADYSVCYRTQRFLYEKYKERPAQIQTYMTFKSLWQIMYASVIGGIFTSFAKFECSRNMLLKYPKLLSGGLASYEGPKPEVMENLHFSIKFIAKGWTEKLAELNDEYKDPPNKEMITEVSGVNPAYGATCVMLLLSAITILRESNKMPDNGGVLPPGAAFAKTSLIDELNALNENGLKFEVISSKVI